MTDLEKLQDIQIRIERILYRGVGTDEDGMRYVRISALNIDLSKARRFIKEAIKTYNNLTKENKIE